MTEPTKDKQPPNPAKPRSIDAEKYARLREEAAAPYRGLRQFIYIAFGASGFIGAVVFLSELVAGREVDSAMPNFALQVGIVALMVWLFRLEQRVARKKRQKKGWFPLGMVISMGLSNKTAK